MLDSFLVVTQRRCRLLRQVSSAADHGDVISNATGRLTELAIIVQQIDLQFPIHSVELLVSFACSILIMQCFDVAAVSSFPLICLLAFDFVDHQRQ